MTRARLRFWKNKRGTTVAEFAIIATPLFVFILYGLDVGRQAYGASVLQGTLVQAARMAALEGATQTSVNTFVKNRLSTFVESPGDVSVSITNFRSYSGIGVSEKITTDTAPLGVYNSTDCYIDANNNGVFDLQQGTSGIGGAEDALKVTVTMTMKRIAPTTTLFGMTPTITMSRSTTIQSEPYAGTVDPPTRCS